jgi:hypothetical protein
VALVTAARAASSSKEVVSTREMRRANRVQILGELRRSAVPF